MNRTLIYALAPLRTGVLALLLTGSSFAARATETIAVSEFPRHTHIHGLAVDRQDPSKLLIATHHGLFVAESNARAERISEVQDFMGFNPHQAIRTRSSPAATHRRAAISALSFPTSGERIGPVCRRV